MKLTTKKKAMRAERPKDWRDFIQLGEPYEVGEVGELEREVGGIRDGAWEEEVKQDSEQEVDRKGDR